MMPLTDSISSHSCTFADFRGKLSSSILLLDDLRSSRTFRYSSHRSRRRRRCCLFVKNVASDQQQKLQDSLANTTDGIELDAFQPDAASVASSIKYHEEFTPMFSSDRFELPKAYHATAESVRDMLIINWNATCDYYEKMKVKQA